MRTRSQTRNCNRQQQAPPAVVEPFNLEEPFDNPPLVPMADKSGIWAGIAPSTHRGIVSETLEYDEVLLIGQGKKPKSRAVKRVEQSCVTCGGAHSYRNCPATDGNVYRDNIQEYVSQAVAANFNQGNTNSRPPMVANQIRPPGQVYQPPTSQPPVYQAHPYQAPAPQMQGVSKTDFENYVKANDAILRNMQNQGQGTVVLYLDAVRKVNKNLGPTSKKFNPRSICPFKERGEKLLSAGLIYPISDSPWVSPVHCVPKKGGMTVVTNDENELVPTRLVTGWRVCIDYRKLNEATRKDHFPLPFMDQMLERLAGNEYYCFLDGFSGYFQIPIDPKDQEKTTFTCPYGTFAYRRMPFGLCNAPGTFQRCMMAIFHDMMKKDDGCFPWNDFSVFRIILSHRLALNWKKAILCEEGIVLRHKFAEMNRSRQRPN
ncbi:reverse transcriptase domain-containing protein [Tanacetum coccineum]